MSTKEKKPSKSKDKKEKSVDKSKLDKSESKKKDKKEKKEKDPSTPKSVVSELHPPPEEVQEQFLPPPAPVTPPPPPQQPIDTFPPPEPQFLENKHCQHHHCDLVFFCETCEEAICRNCTKLGPHNNQLHRINTLEEAFKTRVEKLREVIQNNLLEKRDSVLAQIHRIEYRTEEIKYVKAIIERDAKGEFNGIIERLKTSEGQKLAVLQHEMGELQRDIDKINVIRNAFLAFTSVDANPIDFLIRARQLYENIEFLVAKPFKVNIEVYPYDLPRELTEMRLQLQKASAQQALVDFKNEIIWKIMEERQDGEQGIKAKMESAAAAEINQWAELTDKIQNELKTCTLICFYCGAAMEENSINKKCKANVSAQGIADGFTEKGPTSGKFNGTKRHFFARPKSDYMSLTNVTKSDGVAGARGSAPLYHFIEVQLNLAKQLCSEKGVDIVQVFSDHDKANQGTVNAIQFSYILTQIIGLAIGDVESIRRFFDPKNRNVINFTDVLQIMDDPSTIGTIHAQLHASASATAN